MDNNDNDSYIKCQSCFKPFSIFDRPITITNEFVFKFLEICQIELEVSLPSSSSICTKCDAKVSEFYNFRKEIHKLHKNSSKLIPRVKLENLKSELDSDFEAQNFEVTECYQSSPVGNREESFGEILDETPSFSCNLCDKQYKNRESLSRHTRKFHGKETRKLPPTKASDQFLCSICAKIIKGGTSNLKNHMLISHSENFNFFCDLCPYKSKTKRNLVVHIKTHRQHQDMFNCSLCPASFKERKMLNRHTFRKHIDLPKLFKCDCGKAFKSQTYLTHHYNQVHKTGHFPCDKCPDKVFATKVKLTVHLTEVHAEKKSCEVCGKMISGRRKMLNHMKTHGGPTFKCTFENCNKEFFGNEALKDHIAIRHNEVKSFICPTCGNSFATIKTLRKHISRQHSGERIPCGVPGCKHSAARKDYLAAHYKTHKDIDEDSRKSLLASIKEIKSIGW